MARLLPPGTTGTVTVTSATGYTRRLPLTDDLLLATDVAGEPLFPGHGAPVRLVASEDAGDDTMVGGETTIWLRD